MADTLEEIKAKYKRKLEEKLGGKQEMEKKIELSDKIISKQYETFKEELLPVKMTIYEKACNTAEKILKISPDKKKIPLIQKDIDAVHLQITPTGVYSLSILGPLALMFIGIVLSMFIPAFF